MKNKNKRKIVKICTISQSNPLIFDKFVNAKLEEGWELYGDFKTGLAGGSTLFIQALAKREEKVQTPTIKELL